MTAKDLGRASASHKCTDKDRKKIRYILQTVPRAREINNLHHAQTFFSIGLYGQSVTVLSFNEQGWPECSSSALFTERMEYTPAGKIDLLTCVNNGVEQNSRHSYDGLGRMTDGPVSYDPVCEQQIEWNFLSLPSHTFYEGRDEDIFYTYLADGTLLVSDKSDDSDVHVYAGCLVTDCDGELAEAVFSRGVMDYGTTRYQMKDHLGSVRVTFDCGRIPELRCQVLRPQNRLFPLSRSQGRAIFRN